ncbi:phospho-sugar mutase [Lacisediminihabitans profunda]|uniref:Phospho-sugar mutase n=1 Tax=Lacisediminihabitans profunda TaxID=2594790 RepID=A0A5C8ULD2_9MICO|nr:phospho-sugar mutase [Lacisediminihabitans profunda]TXN28273.1 phospho-sugar mutase [Lacisediminihabitans profunda]
MTRDVLEAARAWLGQDPDAETREELSALIAVASTGDAGATAELHDRFDTRLEFGTAGLRGRIEAGSNRMNRVLVAQAAAGLAAFLVSREEHPSVVIGYDGRKNSRVFAMDTAELMAGAGVRAILLPRLLPTPVLAFAVRHFGVSAGVMVTASHNPPRDNGYKVYLGGEDNGSQIVPPSDAAIAEQILRVAAERNVLDLPRSTDFEVAGEEVLDEYVRRTAALVSAPAVRPLFVYTALHGVGYETAHRVFVRAGFGAPVIVTEQIEPDAEFPTVAFPNPEEPGALDLAFELASRVGAELVIANDPDADRLAVAIPDAAGGWERLSGNEVGALLGWRAAERITASGPEGVLVTSIVSSPALAAVAREYRLEYVDTLTGFKWVSRVPGISYGYEEALGYLVDPDKVRDKDGISAALDFLALFAELKSSGTSFAQHRRDFADRFGAFASAQVSIRVSDLAEIPRIMTRLRANPPERLGATAVRQIDDFADGFEQFPPGDILRLWLEDGSRVIVRPSGTEPKVKVYIDASSVAGSADERIALAASRIAALEAAVRPLVS